MKYIRILAAATIIIALLWACEKDNTGTPSISNTSVSDCHTNTDKLAVKDMSTDSIVVSWTGDNNPMQIVHYNMVLDCGEPNIITTVETNGNTVTVIEHVGEQGLTNCICLYDNSFHINNLPSRPFTLVIKVESLICGNPVLATVYEKFFE
ncbi:MAG: hypothetical protein J5848_01370 [Bacteroidales bacterium]|nr:hypothetical protein [Bacteroidales bacterium]